MSYHVLGGILDGQQHSLSPWKRKEQARLALVQLLRVKIISLFIVAPCQFCVEALRLFAIFIYCRLWVFMSVLPLCVCMCVWPGQSQRNGNGKASKSC